jgi:hypothetical protein
MGFNMYEPNPHVRCGRCGAPYYTGGCYHLNTARPTISAAEGDRMRARWAYGKLFNPDHDTTSYRDPVDARD